MSERDAVVRPLYRDATSGSNAYENAASEHPMTGLDADIDVVRNWPRRTALVLGEQPHPQVPAVMHKFGFSTAVTGMARAQQVASALGPFTFLIVSPDCLSSDDSVAAVRGLHAISPSARVLLECSADGLDPQVLVRALRAGVADVVDPAAPAALDEAIAIGLRQAGALRERVLAIGAHPDDVEIGCAGTLLDHRMRGDRVSILTLSRGAVGGDQAERVEESTATAEAIGAQLLFGDLPDTRVDEGVATIRLIESVVQAIDPTVIYVHSKNDGHQDHRAVATATASAARNVRRLFAFQSPSATNDFKPTQFVAIDSVLQRKVQVLQMFDSQNGRSYLDPELIVAGSRYWARHLGANARYAEPFEVIRSAGDLRHSADLPIVPQTSRPGFAIPSYLPSTEPGIDHGYSRWA